MLKMTITCGISMSGEWFQNALFLTGIQFLGSNSSEKNFPLYSKLRLRKFSSLARETYESPNLSPNNSEIWEATAVIFSSATHLWPFCEKTSTDRPHTARFRDAWPVNMQLLTVVSCSARETCDRACLSLHISAIWRATPVIFSVDILRWAVYSMIWTLPPSGAPFPTEAPWNARFNKMHHIRHPLVQNL